MKTGIVVAAALFSVVFAVSVAQAACPRIPSTCGECLPEGQPGANPKGCIQIDDDNYFAGSAETVSGCFCVNGSPLVLKDGTTTAPVVNPTSAACSTAMTNACK